MTFPYQNMMARNFGLVGVVLDGAGDLTGSSLHCFTQKENTLPWL